MKKRLILFALLCSSCTETTEIGSNFIVTMDAAPDANIVPVPACVDGIDNDGDGKIDFPFEPGCEDNLDQSEEDEAVKPACFNNIDDDGDGIVDFPWEPGCVSASDNSEEDPSMVPECADGIDNDGNGDIDYADDVGCYAKGAPTESRITS